MSGLEWPRNLVEAAAGDDDDLAARGVAAVTRAAWMRGLPALVDEVAAKLRLDVGSPFQPGGVASWVAPVRTATGSPAVLKLGWVHDEALHEAEALDVWAGNGAVMVQEHFRVDATNVLMLEACRPGRALADTLDPVGQDVVVAGILRRLWVDPPAGHPFRPLVEMCRWWADSSMDRFAAAEASPLDPGLYRTGIELFTALPTSGDRSVLLCTDLHAGNVLAAEREPWLAIDPKPYVGDPAYDVVQHMVNHPGRLTADPGRFVDRMADLVGVDADRVRLWVFARCVVESTDWADLRPAAIALAP
jgi:streptomycin 6-kinase